jgi:DNA-binding XRE family transcriptional regulator
MDVAASVESSNQSQVAQEVGVSLLRKQLDTAQSSAAQLLQVLPQQQVSLEPGKGSLFDSDA